MNLTARISVIASALGVFAFSVAPAATAADLPVAPVKCLGSTPTQSFNEGPNQVPGFTNAPTPIVFDLLGGDDIVTTRTGPGFDLGLGIYCLRGGDDQFGPNAGFRRVPVGGFPPAKGRYAVSGGDGNDTIEGGLAGDSLGGELGADVLLGGGGGDLLFGQNDNDRLSGQVGDDILFGGNGDDQLDGGDGNDRLSGDAGRDQVLGGAGDDQLIGELGDILDGGPGFDICQGTSRTKVNCEG